MNLARALGTENTGVWLTCLTFSIAVHAMFVLGTTGGGPHRALADEPLTASTFDVHLSATSALALRQASIESQWTPLQPLSGHAATKPAKTPLLRFVPVEIGAHDIDESAYLALSRLTLRPAPLTQISVPYPVGVQGVGSVTARVTVFIDEDGNVAKVVLADNQLPSAFAAAANDAFEHARFRPGLIGDTPVKVRMLIEVNFDSFGKRSDSIR